MENKHRATSFFLLGFTIIVAVFLLAPILVIVASAFTATDYVVFPPKGFSLKWFVAAALNEEFRTAFFVSLGFAAVNSLLAPIIGGCAALAIARSNFKGRDALTTFLLSPLMLPSIVIGVALLQFFASVGLLNSAVGVCVGHLLVTVPYAVRLVAVSLGGFNWELERAAQIHGATRFDAYRLVVIPLILPGLAGAAVFGFILSFDEVTVSLFTTGPNVMTLPVIIFRWIEFSYDPVVVAASAITVFVAALAIFGLDKSIGLSRVFIR